MPWSRSPSASTSARDRASSATSTLTAWHLPGGWWPGGGQAPSRPSRGGLVGGGGRGRGAAGGGGGGRPRPTPGAPPLLGPGGGPRGAGGGGGPVGHPAGGGGPPRRSPRPARRP